MRKRNGSTRKSMEGIAWHYTTGQKFERIAKSGYLLPTAVGVEPPERPVIWFSLNQEWEATAAKMATVPGGIRMLTKDETCQLGGGLVRFGYPAQRCIPWPRIWRRAKTPPLIRAALERIGRDEGANPAEWCGVLHPIPVRELIVDVLDEGHWVRVQDRAEKTAATGPEQPSHENVDGYGT